MKTGLKYLKNIVFLTVTVYTLVQSPPPPPPNTADLGTDEKAAVFGNRRYCESYITYKTLIWDLEMGGGIGEGEAVLGGAVLGGAVLGGATVLGGAVLGGGTVLGGAVLGGGGDCIGRGGIGGGATVVDNRPLPSDWGCYLHSNT